MNVWLARVMIWGEAGARERPVLARGGGKFRDAFVLVVVAAVVGGGAWKVKVETLMRRLGGAKESEMVFEDCIVMMTEGLELVGSGGFAAIEPTWFELDVIPTPIKGLTTVVAVLVVGSATSTGAGVCGSNFNALSTGPYVKPPTTTGSKLAGACSDCKFSRSRSFGFEACTWSTLRLV